MANTLILLFFLTLALGLPVVFTMGVASTAAILIDGSLNPASDPSAHVRRDQFLPADGGSLFHPGL